jgi:hypothetical protein
MANSVALWSTLNMLQYWHDQLAVAVKADDQARSAECAKFIDEYDILIARGKSAVNERAVSTNASGTPGPGDTPGVELRPLTVV